jgi:hypothetical protein
MNRKMNRIALIVASFASLGVLGLATPAQAQNWVQEEEVDCVGQGSVAGGFAAAGGPQAAAAAGAGTAGQCLINENAEEITNGVQNPDEVADDVVGGTQDAVEGAQDVAEDGKQFIDKHNPF